MATRIGIIALTAILGFSGCASGKAGICKAPVHKRGVGVVVTWGDGKPPSVYLGIAGRTHAALRLAGRPPCGPSRGEALGSPESGDLAGAPTRSPTPVLALRRRQERQRGGASGDPGLPE